MILLAITTNLSITDPLVLYLLRRYNKLFLLEFIHTIVMLLLIQLIAMVTISLFGFDRDDLHKLIGLLHIPHRTVVFFERLGEAQEI
jgi:hypothetical protein